MEVKFISLSSGSSGNCFYLGTSACGILIDAGIGVRMIRKSLRERGIAIEAVIGILVTHDHADHVKSVGNLSAHLHIPVYATSEIHQGMDRCYVMSQKIPYENRCYVRKEEPFNVAGFTIISFEIPHDGTDNVGYFMTWSDHRFCIITDIGHITPIAQTYIQQAEYLVIESNYDEQMLSNGPYPQYLKDRIRGQHGHLSNQELANYLTNHCPPLLKAVWLCHLSKENNDQTLAYQEAARALSSVGVNVGTDVRLVALERTVASKIYDLD